MTEAAWQGAHVRLTATGTTAATGNVYNVVALLLLPVLCALGLFGNSLVCLAIWFDRRLQNVTNYFLFSLALADLLVCGIVMPLSLVVEVRNGIWKPLRARNKSKTMIMIKIAFVWVATVIISSPIAIAAVLDHRNIYDRGSCVITNRYYMIYGSTFAFLIPFVIMAVTYVKTTKLLQQQTTLISNNPRNQSQPEMLRRTVTHHRHGTLSLANGMGSSFRATTLPVFPENELQLSNHTVDELGLTLERLRINNKIQLEKSRLRTLRDRTTTAIFALASKISKKDAIQTSSAELANEHKATRVLAVVFACFFICWTPFFVANFAVGFCGPACAVPTGLASFFLWLGYFSSTINPLIYTIFNSKTTDRCGSRRDHDLLRVIGWKAMRANTTIERPRWRQKMVANQQQNFGYNVKLLRAGDAGVRRMRNLMDAAATSCHQLRRSNESLLSSDYGGPTSPRRSRVDKNGKNSLVLGNCRRSSSTPELGLSSGQISKYPLRNAQFILFENGNLENSLLETFL